jgi:hypothetical protein
MAASTQKGPPTLLRAEADRLLGLVIAKARYVNAHPEEYPYGIQTIAVFGSYLTDKSVLGDLDIGVEVVRVRAPEYFGHYARDIHWAEKATKALRLRRPRVISVHWLAEVKAMKAPYKEVFSRSMPDQ